MDNLTKRQKQILKILYQQADYYAASSLALDLKLSVRTIKSDINQISNQATIFNLLSKPGKGYRLEVDPNFLDLFLEEVIAGFDDNTLAIPETHFERMVYLIRKLLVVDYHLKSDDLADELYLAKSTLYLVLKEVRQQLSRFRLTLVSRPNYGLIIEGTEMDKRLAISEFFYHNFSLNGENVQDKLFDLTQTQVEFNELAKVIKEYCGQYQIMMSKNAVDSVTLHLLISIKRVKLYNYATLNDDLMDQFQNTLEFKAAQNILQVVEKKEKLLFPIQETLYLALQIQAKKISKVSKLSLQENNKLKTCIQTIIFEINNNFGLTIKQDQEFEQYLYFHIIGMLNRLRLHLPLRNPLVYDNLRRYLFATKVTHSAYSIIQQFYRVDFNIDEFGYLLLYINLEITKSELNQKLNIAFVQTTETAQSMMYYLELCDFLSSSKYNVQQVQKIDQPYDLIISSQNLKTDMPYINCQQPNFLQIVRQKIMELRYHNFSISKYFSVDYCQFNLKGETKSEVLFNLAEHLYQANLLYNRQDEYNKFHDDEIGNGVVHLQDSFRNIKVGMCYFAVLDKPIYWNNNFVKLIIITKTKKDGDADLYNLCRLVSKIVEDRQLVNQIAEQQDFATIKKIVESKVK